MNQKYYFTIQMINDFHDQYIKKYRKYPGVAETLMTMKSEKLLSEEVLPMPEISELMSAKDFRQAFLHIPFEANQVIHLDSDGKAVSESGIFPIDKDVYCIPHIHNFGSKEILKVYSFFTVTYILKGRCDFLFEEQSIELCPGDICIIAPDSKYYMQPQSDTISFELIIRSSSFTFLFSELLATESVLSEFFRNALLRKNYENYMIIHSDRNNDGLRICMQACVTECFREETFSNACTISLMKLFLTKSFQSYEHQTIEYNRSLSNIRPDANSIIKYIQNNYRDVTLSQAAQYFHYNRTYLSRLIHSHFNKSFMEIVTELRIAHAEEYLKNSNRKIADIATLVGYDSADHFSRTFKNIVGISPAFYRKKYRPDY